MKLPFKLFKRQKLPSRCVKMAFDAQAVKEWFLEKKRDLPWRQNPSAYAVWISEVMLQQTQAAVVEHYFLKWMKRFPDVSSLAAASLEEVMKMWEGLGYYSRARHLHAAACHFVRQHAGEIPNNRQELEKIKGLGPYTIGAILSFAFRQKAAAIDANVARVLARYFCIEQDITLTQVRKRIWELAEDILPQKEPWLVMEGLIELGATVCKRRPECFKCPLKMHCRALQKGKELSLPIKKKPKPTIYLTRQVLVIHHNREFLLRKAAIGSVMADLYEFPYFEDKEDIAEHIKDYFPFPLVFEQALQEQSHTFTCYKAQLIPSVWKALEKKPLPDYHWIEWARVASLAFSSGHRRILNSYENFTY